MTGLEKKQRSKGWWSVKSARALSLKDMHNLYDLCFRANATPAEMRWGIVRYVGVLPHSWRKTQAFLDCVSLRLALTPTIRRGYSAPIRDSSWSKIPSSISRGGAILDVERKWMLDSRWTNFRGRPAAVNRNELCLFHSLDVLPDVSSQ